MKTIPNLPSLTRKALPVLLAQILSLFAVTFSQAAKVEDKIIELSPFEVDASKDTGYAAQNTLAGSRLNSRLKDTAATMSVFTVEFLDDIGATSIADALKYSVNAEVDLGDTSNVTSGGNEVLENAYNFRIRGLTASRARNYFKWTLGTDSYNMAHSRINSKNELI